MISPQNRGLTIIAESDGVVYVITMEAYDRIVDERPDLAQAFLS